MLHFCGVYINPNKIDFYKVKNYNNFIDNKSDRDILNQLIFCKKIIEMIEQEIIPIKYNKQ